MRTHPLILIVISHPFNPWIKSRFRTRAETPAAAVLLAKALEQRIRDHELN